jgi:LPXTG-site transpeptidase (sortase) family protein
MMRVAGGLAVTHYGPSGLLDGNSNAVLYGHDDIEGSVFGSLASLKPGDTIYLTPTGGSQLAYTVSDGPRRVSPTTTSILAPSASPRLTLFTCYPTYVDTQRVYVVAAPSHGA